MSTDTRQQEITELRRTTSGTLRPTVAALEAILYQVIPVLDHGFIRVVDYMGDDASIVQAARVSYGRGTKKVSEDRSLIRYLMRQDHTTPFEMAEIKLHVKLPIFVARQWIRHRTASVNEYSARYSILDKEFYLPERKRLAGQSQSNRQGTGDVLEESEATEVLRILRADAEKNYENYSWMLNEGATKDSKRKGLARELARINLSLSTYTQWYWKTDLHNLLHFIRLRADTHAQYEIRAYAEEILKVVQKWVPHTFDAFLEYQFGAVTLSRTAISIVTRLLAGERITQETSSLSVREWNEITKVFKIE
jgi:thymidylate synthase (FAD)